MWFQTGVSEGSGLASRSPRPRTFAWKSAALRNAGCDPRRSATCAAVTLRARFTGFAKSRESEVAANETPTLIAVAGSV